MIDKNNFNKVLIKLGFTETGNILYKDFPDIEATLKADFREKKLIYPIEKGFTISGEFTTSFTQKENFVVFECVHRLFDKGYKPQHIELEPKWTVGHGASGGRADIMVKDNSGKSLLIIECKTSGKEFNDEWKNTLINGGQILSYAKQAGSTQFVSLYSSDFIDDDVKANYYLITLKDNEKLLEELADKEPLSYEKAKLLDKEDIYHAWKETYAQDYATKGIFEDDIPAYEIGKTKYSLDGLSTISSNDIQGKYHQFATILRQHNVSGRENAFDKLVNLFLCKIVDETNNPEELKFYWKGIAYDSFFELQDRLQKLYQEGMKRFLGEDVTYIDNEAIDQAFRFFKNDPDATRETIKKYFRELKFFTNNDFAFIDVHNEKLFYQNAAVLLKIVQMLQDIHLKTEEENQFLGDMFEGFLDQGIKQSEGQFFTPMPIVKFILKSLPLDQIIIQSDQIPKVIDYACGAGHFLNEYAQEIKSIVEQHKEVELKKYFENVVGIEKEYRLSKVAKVSAFMYGQDDINIVYADALANIPIVKDKNYSVLVSNPPYSVKGFLETVSDIDRKKYQLIETVSEKSYPNNNSIETFFLERAKQLLKPDGVAGIIAPSSILTKGKAKSTSKSTNIYVATREILLKYFDIVAIVEFGSGTFGKTGTNTVTLFIRRKKENPAPADHYQNRVNAWFKGDKTKNGVFKDEYFIKKYCNHLELKFDDYQTLLDGYPSKSLLETGIFKEYQKEFDRWTDIKNRKQQRTFQALSKEKQKAELEKRFLAYVQEAEKEKLYYFVLASLNPQKVLIVKSPSKNTEIKEFLGYEWSSAKGNEGIKYLGGVALDEVVETEDMEEGNVALEEEDKRVLSNIFNLNNIITPLYDPKDINNTEKINYLIAQNFKGEIFKVSEKLKHLVSLSDLTNMLEFSSVNFNKQLRLNPPQSQSIESKWSIVKISQIADTSSGGTPKSDNPAYYNGGTIPWINSGEVKNGLITETQNYISHLGLENSSAKIFPKNTVLVAMYGATAGQVGILGIEATTNQAVCGILPSEKYEPLYLFNYLSTQLENFLQMRMGVARLNLSQDIIKEFKIPLPPLEVQKQIVDACGAIDKEAEEAEKTIQSTKIEMEKTFEEAFSKSNKLFRLGDDDIFEVSIGKRVLQKEINKKRIGIPVYSANVFEPFGYIEKQLLDDFSSPSVLWGIDGDWMVNCLPAKKQFYPTDHCGVIRIKSDKIHPRYLAWVLNREGQRVRFSRHNRASLDRIKGLSINAPSTKVQTKLVTEIEKCEQKIKKSKDLINGISKRKEDVIKEYL